MQRGAGGGGGGELFSAYMGGRGQPTLLPSPHKAQPELQRFTQRFTQRFRERETLGVATRASALHGRRGVLADGEVPNAARTHTIPTVHTINTRHALHPKHQTVQTRHYNVIHYVTLQ